ncbi:MAG TPA: Holliday junction branch migration protein RuvA, partial [Polyangiaceae bacterium]|nr:Holliday junction branch migration protein RuvA [Polyangiaceae bacterium]
GFKPGEAERAVATLGARASEAPLQDVLREALGLLAK